MEFIKVFEEAKKLGMTKEEFLPIWEMESRKKQLDGGDRTTLPYKDVDRSQSESTDYQANKTKTSQPWQQIKDELHQDLQLKLQYMFNEMTEKQELHWKQLWQTNEQQWNEVHKHFGILNDHIKNASDTLTSSLKLFLLQEISLLEQELKRMIISQSTEQESLLVPQKQVTLQDCQGPCDKTDYFYKESITSVKEAETIHLSQQDLNDSKSKSHQQKQVKKKQAHLPDSASDICVDEQKKKLHSKDLQHSDVDSIGREQGKVLGETQRNVHSQSNSGNLPLDPRHNYQKTSKAASVLNISPGIDSTAEPSIKATGSYAEAISMQIKALSLTNEAKSSTAVSGKELDKCFYNKSVTKRLAPSPSDHSKAGSGLNDEESFIRFIPTDFTTLTINNSDMFTTSHEKHMTPFYYTKSRACKIKLCIWFNENFQLNVSLIVSNGLFDSSAKWPINFTGSGFIYNESSQATSQIWALGPLQCNKPEREEDTTFKAAVSLKTLKSTTPNVTYHTICDKGYALSHKLCFHWNLIASEK